eukprot:6197577-Pleurochrysis_carterae.AAC.1
MEHLQRCHAMQISKLWPHRSCVKSFSLSVSFKGRTSFDMCTLKRCASFNERALRDAFRPLPALACAADDLERTAFYASSALDAQEVLYSGLTFYDYDFCPALRMCSQTRPADAAWLLSALACAADDLGWTGFFAQVVTSMQKKFGLQ